MNTSAVITVFNKETEIARALRSVGNQTVSPNEIIVVDDGSADKSAEIVEKIQMPGLRLVRQGNTGVYGSRNRGIIESQYDLIAFLDGDDTWEPGFLEAIKEMREKYPNCGIYSTAYQTKETSGETLIPIFRRVPMKGKDGILENYFITASKVPVLSSSSVAVPRKVFNNVGMFTINAGPGGDKEMWMRIAADFPVAFCNKALATWHIDASNRVSKTCHYRPDPPVVSAGQYILTREDLADDIRRGLSVYLKNQLVFQAVGLILSGKCKMGCKILLQRGIPFSCSVKLFKYLCFRYLPKSMALPLCDLDCMIRRNIYKIRQQDRTNNSIPVKLGKNLEIGKQQQII